jgi:two-component system, NtrC family, sensor kinase
MRAGTPDTELQTDHLTAGQVSKTGWWRHLAEQSRDGIVVLGYSGRVFWSNDTFAAMLGCPREEVRRLKVWDWDKAIPADAIRGMLEAIDEAGDHFETVHTRRDGTTYDVEICSNAVKFHNRKLVLCVCRDISERKRSERRVQQLLAETKSLADKLSQQQDVLVQAEKLASIGRLAAGVAHEINNPLAFILGNLDSLRQFMDGLDEVTDQARVDFALSDAQAMLADLVDGVGRIRTIVSHLQVFTDLDDAGCADVAISDLVDAAVAASQGARGPDCQVIVDVEEGLPLVHWFRRTMERTLANLLTNAAQAIEGHGTVRISARSVGAERVVLVVSDNGVGIPAENLRRVFDPFFTTRDVGAGTGLGLHVAHASVERHGGKIAVESRVGAGTSFTIMLPVRVPE